MPAPAATPVPLDPVDLETLAEEISAEALTSLDFAQRFTPFSGASRALALRAGEWVAWAEGAAVRLHHCVGDDATPLAAAEVHLVFQHGAPLDMGGANRSGLVDVVAVELADQVWDRLDGLFKECAPAARHLFATPSGVFGPGVVEAFLDSGVLVAYHPEALCVAVVGSATRQFLAAEDEEGASAWHLVVQVQFTAALRITDARRLLAEGPGPS